MSIITEAKLTIQDELIERIPLKKLKYLASLTYDQFLLYGGKKEYKNEPERKRNYEILINFCKSSIANNGVSTRQYTYSKDTVENLGGRMYAGNSVQGLQKNFRGFLMMDITTDIDMKNAHPVILKYICKKHNISTPFLEHYINNREAIIGTDENRDRLKTHYLKALNDSQVNYSNKDKTFRKFDIEMKMIQKAITSLPDYQDIVNSVPEDKRYNILGSALNRILCMFENKILWACKRALKDINIECAVNMFDGVMIYGDKYDDLKLLEHITRVVEEKFVGLSMEWSYKPHSDTIKLPENFDESVNVANTYVKSDMEATERLFSLYPYWKYCNDRLYVFNKKTGMWSDKNTIFYDVIQSYKDDLMTNENTSYGNSLNLMERIPLLMKILCIDDDWINQKASSSLGKILFSNGYYDFKEKKFYDKFNPDIVFFGKIYHNFTPFTIEELVYMENLKQRLFYDTLGKDVGDYFIETLSRGLAGDIQKRMLFGLGGTNTGKSVLTKALQLACGDYVGGFNAENMAYRNTSNDEAQIMRWVMLLKYKRIIISNEMKSTCELNGNFIKKLSNGGSDMLVGRSHSGNEETFTPHFLPIVLANDLPKITPYDDAIDNRVRVISYTKQFVDEPDNEYELKKDDSIKDELKSEVFQRCLVGILIQQYLIMTEKGECNEPDEVKQAKKNWIGERVSGGFMQLFLGDYTITNDKNDYVESSEIEHWVEKKKLGISMKKFGMEMKKYLLVKKFEKVENKLKKIDGKPKVVWFGIKFNEEIEEV